MKKTRTGYVWPVFLPYSPDCGSGYVVIELLLDKGWGREEAQERARELFSLFDFPGKPLGCLSLNL